MKHLPKALSEFQNECPVIMKSTKGYNYKYADLPTILNVITPLLAKHGLVLTQPIQQGVLETRLIHIESGEEIVSCTDMLNDVDLAKMNSYQSWGAGLTYWRRYTLSSMLGIVTDEDNDAAGQQVTKSKKSIKVGTPQFTHCVNKYIEGVSRATMAQHVNITDAVWKQIVITANESMVET